MESFEENSLQISHTAICVHVGEPDKYGTDIRNKEIILLNLILKYLWYKSSSMSDNNSLRVSKLSALCLHGHLACHKYSLT